MDEHLLHATGLTPPPLPRRPPRPALGFHEGWRSNHGYGGDGEGYQPNAQRSAASRIAMHDMVDTLEISDVKAVCLTYGGNFLFGVHRGAFFGKHVQVTNPELTTVLESMRDLLPFIYSPELKESDGDHKIPTRRISDACKDATFTSAGIFNETRLISVRTNFRPLDLKFCKNLGSTFYPMGNGLALDLDNVAVFLHPERGIVCLLLKRARETQEVKSFLHRLAQSVFSCMKTDVQAGKIPHILKKEVLPHPAVRAFIKEEARALQLRKSEVLTQKAFDNVYLLTQLILAFQASRLQMALFEAKRKKQLPSMSERSLEMLENAREVKKEQAFFVSRSKERKARAAAAAAAAAGYGERRGNLPQYGDVFTPQKYFTPDRYDGQPCLVSSHARRALDFNSVARKPRGPHAELFEEEDRRRDSTEFGFGSSSSSSAPGFVGGARPYWRQREVQEQLQKQQQQQQQQEEVESEKEKAAADAGSQVRSGPTTSQIIEEFASQVCPLGTQEVPPLFGNNESYDTQPLILDSDEEEADRAYQDLADIMTPSPDSTSDPSLLCIDESPEAAAEAEARRKEKKKREKEAELSLSSETLGLNLPKSRSGGSSGGGCSSPMDTSSPLNKSNKENEDPAANAGSKKHNDEEGEEEKRKKKEEEEKEAQKDMEEGILSPAVRRTRRRAAMRRQAISAVLGTSRSKRLGFLDSSSEEEEESKKRKRHNAGSDDDDEELPDPKKTRV